MVVRKISGFVVIVALFLPLHSAGQATAPWLGTWKLNPQKSTGTASASRYKRVTTRIEPLGNNGLKVTYDMVGIRGGVAHMEWSGALDGKDHPLQGVDNVLTNAYTLIDDHSYRIAIKVDGMMVATATVTVSEDGKTLTTVTQEKNAQGREISTTAVYERQ